MKLYPCYIRLPCKYSYDYFIVQKLLLLNVLILDFIPCCCSSSEQLSADKLENLESCLYQLRKIAVRVLDERLIPGMSERALTLQNVDCSKHLSYLEFS